VSEDKLDITSLKNAVQALRKSIDVYEKNYGADIDLLEVLRAGVIHNFKIAYETTYKTMKRWLEINISSNIVAGVTYKEFYRIAAENRLIFDIEKWLDFHEGRNKIAFTYDGLVAKDVFNMAMNFLPYAQNFVKMFFVDTETNILTGEEKI
jgi:nucleotidyltransferase substrate binding protein (TIGR01987 family)